MAKLKMVKKDGKMVPFYAADGKGKMMYGGSKPMMKMGGSTIVGMPGYNARTTTMKYGGRVMNAKSLRGKSSKKCR